MNPTSSDALALPLLTPRPPATSDRPERRRGPNALFRMFQSVTGERRASPRLPVELEWEEHSQGSRYIRLTADLSTFGLAAKEGWAQAPGTRVNVVLRLPEHTLKLSAEVLGPYGPQGGMRLAFRSPSIESVRHIHRFLMARERRS